jgi:hypothetical protein
MDRMSKLREAHKRKLEEFCISNDVPLESILKLLEAEKTKKLFKKSSQVQLKIDAEILKAIGDEN